MLATDTQKPLWLYPNLLSLDAPAVAVSWLYVFSQSWRLYIPWEAYVTLGLAVWSIYAADRLLDHALRNGEGADLEIRHHFHARHKRAFQVGISMALAIAVLLVLTRMPMALLKHLLLGGVLVAGFFGLSLITSQEKQEIPHTKNIIAGVAFAYGTAVTAHVYRSELGIYEMLVSREFLSFSVLCILQISALDIWRHSSSTANCEVQASDELMLTLPLVLLGAASLAYAWVDDEWANRSHFYAILTASALLYLLNRARNRFSLDLLRVLADVALLLPIAIVMAAAR